MKHSLAPSLSALLWSPPVRGRGLKLLCCLLVPLSARRPPCGGVD